MWVFPRNFDRHIDKKLGTCCGCKKLLCQDQNQLLLVQIVDVVYKMIYEMTFFSFCPKHNTTLERKKICRRTLTKKLVILYFVNVGAGDGTDWPLLAAFMPLLLIIFNLKQ